MQYYSFWRGQKFLVNAKIYLMGQSLLEKHVNCIFKKEYFSDYDELEIHIQKEKNPENGLRKGFIW